MIVYFLLYERRHTAMSDYSKARAIKHAGGVTFVRHQVHLLREDGSVFARKAKCTVFDDDHTPPKLIREDYPIKQLRKLRCDLPASYVDSRGDIVNSDGAVILQGP